MNFSRFDYLMSQNKHLKQCVEYCKKAESRARLRPSDTATAARGAIDQLFILQSRINGLRPDNLADSIEKNCKCIKENSETIRKLATHIRKEGNNAVHANVKKGANVDAATQENIERAILICRELYELLSEFYGSPGPFEEIQIPFDDLQILRTVKDSAKINRDNYFVHRVEGGRGEDYYYLQCLSILEEVALESRRQEASILIASRRIRNSRLLLPDDQMSIAKDSDRKLLLYTAFSDSLMLSELNKNMSPKQALRLGLQLCDALEELKQLGMYHRNLYPGCVLLDQLPDGSYEAFLLNLQTSKILGSDATVNHRLAAAWDYNFYVPELLRTADPSKETKKIADADWEKVDAYSLCRIVLFCLDRQLALATTTAMLTEYNINHPDHPLPDCLMNLYRIIFSGNYPIAALPSLSKVREVLTNAYDLCD